MKQHLVLLFFFAATTVFAQTKKFSVGVSGSPLRSGYFSTKRFEGSFNEKHQLGFQIGLLGEYAFSSKLSLRVGAGYGAIRKNRPKSKLLWGQPDPINAEYLATKTITPFVSIPVLLKFQLGKNKKWYGIAGSNLWIPLGVRQKYTLWFLDGTVTTGQNKSDAPPFSSSPLNSSVGLGYELNLTPKIHFFVEPTATLQLTNLSGNELFFRTYTAGLNTGIRF